MFCYVLNKMLSARNLISITFSRHIFPNFGMVSMGSIHPGYQSRGTYKIEKELFTFIDN